MFVYTEKPFARISERELKRYSSSFMLKLVKENRAYRARIRECMGSILKDGKAGIRLVDKMGLFLYDGRKQGICLNKTRFFYTNGMFYIFLVLEDDYDGQIYTLYLEYNYNRKRKSCRLKDIYFSTVFDDKMKEIEQFFRYR